MNDLVIAPSLLACDFLAIKEEVSRLPKTEKLWLHLDIMDGHFVPNLTFGQEVFKDLHKITKFPLDAHLMVENPENYIESFKQINVHNFTFHYEAVTHHDRFISYVKENFESAGMSFNPSTDVACVPEYLFGKLDLVLIMSVNPGFGGQVFIEDAYRKVEYLNNLKKRNNFDFHIQVDGGVKEGIAQKLVDLGATNLVAGSSIFQKKGKSSEAYLKNIKKLKSK